MLLSPLLPEQIDVAVVQEENGVVGRCGVAHVPSDPAVYRIVQSTFGGPFPTVGSRGVGSLGERRCDLGGRGEIGGGVGSEFAQQGGVSRGAVPDDDFELLVLGGERA